jgi:hypothetical protein
MVKAKHGILILGIGSITAAFFFIVVPAQDELLDRFVTTGPDILLDDWRAVFRLWALFGVVVAGLAAVTWFVLGQWGFRLNHWKKAGRRNWWGWLLFISVCAAAPGVFLTPAAQEWGRLSIVFYVIDNFFVYYLSTLLFSPPSFKYTPRLATWARHGW